MERWSKIATASNSALRIKQAGRAIFAVFSNRAEGRLYFGFLNRTYARNEIRGYEEEWKIVQNTSINVCIYVFSNILIVRYAILSRFFRLKDAQFQMPQCKRDTVKRILCVCMCGLYYMCIYNILFILQTPLLSRK